MQELGEMPWAQFPKDDVTFSEFEVAKTKLKSLGGLSEVSGLHSNSFAERSKALYDFVLPMHTVVKSIGRAVELPIVHPGKHKQIGREAAGFFYETKLNIVLESLNIDSVNFVATVDSLGINLSTKSGRLEIILNTPLPDSERKSLVLFGIGLDPRCYIEVEAGGILDPEGLSILEKVLTSSAKALAESI